MPVYVYRCPECDTTQELVRPMAEYKDDVECVECSFVGEMPRVITGVNFVLKGEGWPGKDIKVDNHMMERRKAVGVKQEMKRRDAPATTLVPNVGGEQVDNWTEAKKLAESKGKDTSGYEKMERKEVAKTKKIVVG